MYHILTKTVFLFSRVNKKVKEVNKKLDIVWKHWKMYTQAEEFVEAEVKN